MGFFAPKVNLSEKPYGIDLGRTHTNQEIVAPWYVGHARLRSIWIGDAYKIHLRNPGDRGDNAFCNIAGLLSVHRSDTWQAFFIEDYRYSFTPVSQSTAYYDQTSMPSLVLDDLDSASRIRMHWGHNNAVANRLLTTSERTKDSGGVDDYPIPNPWTIWEGRKIGLGMNNQSSMLSYQFVMSAKPVIPSAITGIDTTLYDGGVNPIAAMIDLFCDQYAGFYGDPSDIDLTTAQAASTQFSANKYARSFHFENKKTATAWLNAMMKEVDGIVRRSGSVFEFTWVPTDGSSGSSVTTLSKHHFTQPPR